MPQDLGGIIFFQHGDERLYLFLRFSCFHDGSVFQPLVYLPFSGGAQTHFRRLAMEGIVYPHPIHGEVAVFPELFIGEQGLSDIAAFDQETAGEHLIGEVS